MFLPHSEVDREFDQKYWGNISAQADQGVDWHLLLQAVHLYRNRLAPGQLPLIQGRRAFFCHQTKEWSRRLQPQC